jgi:hypothetical protein
MKKLALYIIKLLFVIIIPIVAIAILIFFFRTTEVLAPNLHVLLIIVLIVVLLNAMFFDAQMKSVYLTPEVSFEKLPLIAFGIGIDTIDKQLVFVLPFVAISIALK